MDKNERCIAITEKGYRCENKAEDSTEFCHYHNPCTKVKTINDQTGLTLYASTGSNRMSREFDEVDILRSLCKYFAGTGGRLEELFSEELLAYFIHCSASRENADIAVIKSVLTSGKR